MNFTRAGYFRGLPWTVMSRRLEFETTWALVRNWFLPMTNPVPMPPVKRPLFQGVE